MALLYSDEWLFEDDFDPLPPPIQSLLVDLVDRVATSSSVPKLVYERVKSAYGVMVTSSNSDWAREDCRAAIEKFSNKNGPIAVVKFYDAMDHVSKMAEGVKVPSQELLAKKLNTAFTKHSYKYTIEEGELKKTKAGLDIIDVHGESEGAAPGCRGYKLGRQLGAGGYGVVYAAERMTGLVSFVFAVKKFSPYPFTGSTAAADRSKASERFSREIQAAQALHHRGIIRYIDAGITDDDEPYLVMELIEGSDILTSAQALPYQSRVQLMVDVLDALAYAHEQGVLHRDLKPSNIIVRKSDQQPIILDFGMAYLRDTQFENSLTTGAPGTPGYIPIEVLENPKRRDNLHDIYSCGVILYQLFAGTRPSRQNYEPLRDTDERLGKIDAIVTKAIGMHEERFSTAQEFRGSLSRVEL